jgi:hypothetical protein
LADFSWLGSCRNSVFQRELGDTIGALSPIQSSTEGGPKCRRIHGRDREEGEHNDWRIHHERI